MTTSATPGNDRLAQLALLRKPFPPNQIGLLPKPIKKTVPGEERFNCIEDHRDFRKASRDGKACGGWHVPSIHLDYVGHAALTDRLLDVDPEWTYEVASVDELGNPRFDANGGLWIRLTVLGITRPGYGDAQGKTGGNAVKEAIGDALRNAGMRFGLALDLWHKGDLHDQEEEQGKVEKVADEQVKTQERNFLDESKKQTSSAGVVALWREAKKALGPNHGVVTALAERSRLLKDQEDKAEAEAARKATDSPSATAGVDAVKSVFSGAKELPGEPA